MFVKKACTDRDDDDYGDGRCIKWMDVTVKEPLYVPILKFTDPNPKPEGITFIYWEDAKDPNGNTRPKGVRKWVLDNECTFTSKTTTDIETFIQNLNKPKILKTDGTLVDAPVPTSPSSDTSTVDVAASPVVAADGDDV